ncbi:MAG: ABC transporter ATP-binding protein [Dehalococcoidia bacterium]|nr:ABC transporter ATP-binding protein [Dehalococcoidia bacterium]
MTEPIITARGVSRTFSFGGQVIRAVRDVDLDVLQGQLVMVTGRSGSGKTTLLNLLAGLDRPTKGSVRFRGREISRFPERELVALRRKEIGFVFQSFALLPLLSAYENVELPLRIANWSRGEQRKRALECLGMVGLERRASHRPYELSGGERQRVAIARALAHRPCLILADEPTGELDATTGLSIFNLLKEIIAKENISVIVTTHDVTMTRFATVTRHMSDGVFVE